MGSSAWSIWPSLMLDALPDATIKRFASPPILKLPVKNANRYLFTCTSQFGSNKNNFKNLYYCSQNPLKTTKLSQTIHCCVVTSS